MNRRGFLRALGLAPVAAAVAPLALADAVQAAPIQAGRLTLGLGKFQVDTVTAGPYWDGTSAITFDADRFVISHPSFEDDGRADDCRMETISIPENGPMIEPYTWLSPL